MSALLKVNGRDLSAWIEVQHDRGLDPANPTHTEPQFGGSLALREGLEYVGDAVGNRELPIPLILKAASTDAVLQLVRDINTDLFPGAQVEFRPEGATNSTFLDLERGRLEPNYQHFVLANKRLRCVLRLWTEAYGRLGNGRTIAAVSATGPARIAATGILGDVDALANIETRVGSAVASSGRVVMYGVHHSASFNPIHTPAMITDRAANSTVVGASGAIASQYLGVPAGPTIASGYLVTDYLTPPDAHVGRHRVIGVVQSGLSPKNALTLYAEDRFGAPLGPTVTASQNDPAKWQLVDFGEVQVPSRDPRQEPVPTQYVRIIGGGASGAAVIASPAFRLQGLMYLPLDISAGVMRTRGYANTLVLSDSFDRFAALGAAAYLETLPNAEPGPGAWNKLAGALGKQHTISGPGFGKMRPLNAASIMGAAPGASAFYAFGSGAMLTDTQVSLDVWVSGGSTPSTIASGALLDLWPKGQADGTSATVGMWTQLSIGPSANHYLALFSHNGAATTLHASKALGASSASAFYLGMTMKLTVKVVGNQADVYLGTGPLSNSLLSVSHSNFSVAGNPLVRARGGNSSAGGAGGNSDGAPTIDNIVVSNLNGNNASAPDTDARRHFRFQSFPEARAVRANASVFSADQIADFRGNPPRLPAIGSPGASGPLTVFVLAGDTETFVGNDLLDVTIDAVERFQFLRS